MATTTTKFDSNPAPSRTFASQSKLPKLPIPPLEDTCKRYLDALAGLQTAEEHEQTKEAVEDFLKGDGPRIQEKLKTWAEDKDRCVLWIWQQLESDFIVVISRSSGRACTQAIDRSSLMA